MNKYRDSKGRFTTKPQNKKAEPLQKLTKKTMKVKTKDHLQVYSTKKIDEKGASKMRPGAEVIMEFLEATAPSGDQLVRVHKDGSTRTFYTTDKLASTVI